MLSAFPLDRGVERVDVFVRLGNNGDVVAGGGVVDPLAGYLGDQLVEGAGGDATVVDVGVERVGVAGSQLEGRGLFPSVAEAVDSGEFVGASGAAKLVEHAAAADRLELARVADEHQSPSLRHGERHEVVERSRADHAGLVEDERGAGRKPVVVARLTRPPLVEKLGDSVRSHPGLVPQDLGSLCGRRDPEDRAALAVEILACAAQRRGLARACGADDQRQAVLAGDGCGRVGLEDVESSTVKRR